MVKAAEYDPSVRAFTAPDELAQIAEEALRRQFSGLDSKLRRNNRSLTDHLRSRHIGSGQLATGAVDGSALGVGAVSDDKVSDVSASKITAGTLQAIVTLAGAIQAGNLTLDSDHMTLLDASGNPMFELPTGGGEPFLRGQVEATGLLVENDLVLKGANNLMAEGSVVRMGGSATGQTFGNPGAAPGVAIIDETLTLANVSGSEVSQRAGLFHDSSNTSFWTAKHFPDAANKGTVYEFNDNGAFIRSFQVNGVHKVFGVARVGTRVYVLFENTAGEEMINSYAESNLAFLAQSNMRIRLGFELNGDACLGDDGTNLFVCDLTGDGTSETIRFHKFTRADQPVYVSTTNSSGAGNPTFNQENVSLRGFVAAESKWWVAPSGFGGGAGVVAFSTAGVFQANNEFRTRNGQNAVGLAHDGTRFWTGDSSQIITKHSNWTWTTESATYEVVYTYVDDNGAASVGARPLGAGDFETKASPKATIVMRRRTRLRITAAAVNTTGLTNIPTHVGFFMRRTSDGGTYDLQADVALVDDVATQTTRVDYTTDATPDAPPATNTFPGAGTGSGQIARFESSAGAPILRGNGYSRCKVRQTNNQTVTNATTETADFASSTTVADTDSYVETASDRIKFPFVGQYLVIATCRWAVNTTEQRLFFAETLIANVWTDAELDGLRSNVEAIADFKTTQVMSGIIDIPVVDADDGFLRLRVQQDSGAGLTLSDWNLAVIFLGDA